MWWVFRHLYLIMRNTKYGLACILEVRSTLKYDIIRGVNISAQISLFILQLLIPSVYLFLLQRKRGRIIAHLQHHGPFGLFSFLLQASWMTSNQSPEEWFRIDDTWWTVTRYFVSSMFCSEDIIVNFLMSFSQMISSVVSKCFKNNAFIFKTHLGDQEHFDKWHLRHRLNVEESANFCMFNFRSLQLDISSLAAVT